MDERTGEPAQPSSALGGWRGLVMAAAVGLLVLFLPGSDTLSPEGQRLAAIFVFGIILWVTEALPVGVTALLVVVLQPILEVQTLHAAFEGFASPVFFFVLAMFCIAAAITGARLEQRFAYWLLDRAGTDSRRVLAALMLGTAATSTIVSDVPACAIFMTIGVGILSRTGVSRGHSAFGKGVMIGIPIAALIGGVATPAGSSVNILGIHFIEQYGGVRIPFVHWMAFGVPMALMLIPVAIWVILRVFPPEIDSIGHPDEIRRERQELRSMTAREKKMIILLVAMMILWILGSWVPALSTVVVALVGAVVLFFPGVALLSWKRAERIIAWDTLLMIGGVTSIGAASVDSGLAGWLVESFLGGMQDWNLLWILAAISAFTVVIHLALPVGPVVNAVVIPPIALLALGAGQNPALYALPVAFTASCAFLLPLDPVALLTYSKGYYRMLDMARVGVIISVFWVIWMTVLMIWIGPLLGIG